MANRPTAHIGTGGSDGAARSPAAYIVPARRARLGLPVANDNKPPFSRRLRRLLVYAVLFAMIAAVVLV
ncbi:hypothetical protein [Azospirillum rugosum]|uniref:Uncharacterized protein n=1 Tax=Azospirillum rugosum TaxID=416170 RepID=A0ABS4SEV9_9PROT|nr:hypothetical protein [Azospirillum rugosum]MBP2291118.1 hypothetical protein [Azospirillum rugosum]MDQ0524818.1 hypothetical protein [Azospirillum rugosum]